MDTTTYRHGLAALAAATALALGACGGSDSDLDGASAPPRQPAPKFTYTPDAEVCAWVDAHVEPFRWRTDRVGPRNWPEVAPIVTYAHPVRNAQGLALYTLESNDWVLSAHYAEQAEALGLPAATFADPADRHAGLHPHTRLWLQQAACAHGISMDSVSDYFFSAYMPDETAARLSHEQYAARVKQTDLCASDFVFSGMPRPPECDAPTQ